MIVILSTKDAKSLGIWHIISNYFLFSYCFRFSIKKNLNQNIFYVVDVFLFLSAFIRRSNSNDIRLSGFTITENGIKFITYENDSF